MGSSTLGWIILLALGGGAAYYVLRPTSSNGPGCPPAGDTAFEKVLADIRASKTARDVAAAVLSSYENLGCPEAAKKVRDAMAAAGMAAPAPAPSKPRAYKAATPGGLPLAFSDVGPHIAVDPGLFDSLPIAAPAAADDDQFSVAHIPDTTLRYVIQELVARDPRLWTRDEVYYAYLVYMGHPANASPAGSGTDNGRILQSFLDYGKFLPGAHRLDMVTARRDLTRAWGAARQYRVDAGDPTAALLRGIS